MGVVRDGGRSPTTDKRRIFLGQPVLPVVNVESKSMLNITIFEIFLKFKDYKLDTFIVVPNFYETTNLYLC